jgi:hypothetical protein
METVKTPPPEHLIAGAGAGRSGRERHMRHTIYEDPITRKFAIVRLPAKFIEGDRLPILPTARWFSTREEAVAALPELFDQDE